MTPDEVVAEITRRAWRFGVGVLLADTETVPNDGLPCSGYFDFDADIPLLVVAHRHENWLSTLLHEYCHLTQWAEKTPVWVADETGQWPQWLAGKPVRNIRKQIQRTIAMEADCERRTVRMIRELDAPVDIERYTRAANAYLHFYNVMADKRKWYSPTRRPYALPEVLAVANPTLDADFSKTPKALYAALLTCI